MKKRILVTTVLSVLFGFQSAWAICTPEEKYRMIQLGVSNEDIIKACQNADGNSVTTGQKQVIVNVNNSSQNNSVNTQTQMASKPKKEAIEAEKFFFRLGLGNLYIALNQHDENWDSDSQLAVDFLSMLYFPSTMEQGNFGFGFKFAHSQLRYRESKTLDNKTNTEEMHINHLGGQLYYDWLVGSSIHLLPFVEGGLVQTSREVYAYNRLEGEYQTKQEEESHGFGGLGVMLVGSRLNTKGSSWYLQFAAGETGTLKEIKEPVTYYHTTVGFMW